MGSTSRAVSILQRKNTERVVLHADVETTGAADSRRRRRRCRCAAFDRRSIHVCFVYRRTAPGACLPFNWRVRHVTCLLRYGMPYAQQSFVPAADG